MPSLSRGSLHLQRAKKIPLTKRLLERYRKTRPDYSNLEDRRFISRSLGGRKSILSEAINAAGLNRICEPLSQFEINPQIQQAMPVKPLRMAVDLNCSSNRFGHPEQPSKA